MGIHLPDTGERMTTPPEPVPTAPDPTPTPPAPSPDKGFPDATPVAEMTTEQQAAYWKFQARKHEERANARGDYDSLREKAQRFEALERESLTAQERAVAEAREQAREEARRETAPRLVEAEFRAAAAGRIPADRLATLTEDIDMSRYLKDDGTVDAAKVTAKVTAWSPESSVQQQPTRWPASGQGVREAAVTTGREAGKAEAARRFGKTTTT